MPYNEPIPSTRFYRSVELLPEGPVLTTHSLPDVESHDTIVIRPLLVGICRSDLKEILGNRQVRHDFGHEIVATVERSSVSVSLSRGDLVCFDPHIHISRSSGFGELVLAKGDPSALQRAFLKVKPGILLEKLVFCEPMACAQHCVSNLLCYKGISQLDGLRVGIIGAGNAGTLIGLIIRHLGGEVTLFNRSIGRLEFLKERQIFLEDELRMLDRKIGDPFDVIIPTTSFLYAPVLKFATHAVRTNGLLLLYGGTVQGDVLPNTNLNIDLTRRNEQLMNVVCKGKSFQVGGTYGALQDDFSTVMDLLGDSSAHFPVERLITREISLDDLPETLQALTLLQTEYRGKIVVRFQGLS